MEDLTAYPEDNYTVYTNTVGTKSVTGIWPIASGDQCDCGVISYPDPVIGVALGYVHVYEINLQTGGTSLPVTISYDITQFNGSLVADGCDTNVTPQDLKVRVQDGAGNYARVTLSPESLFIAQIDEEVTFTASRGGSRKRLAGF